MKYNKPSVLRTSILCKTHIFGCVPVEREFKILASLEKLFLLMFFLYIISFLRVLERTAQPKLAYFQNNCRTTHHQIVTLEDQNLYESFVIVSDHI